MAAACSLALIIAIRGADWWSIPVLVLVPPAQALANGGIEILSGFRPFDSGPRVAKAGASALLGWVLFGWGSWLFWYEPMSLQSCALALTGCAAGAAPFLFMSRGQDATK